MSEYVAKLGQIWYSNSSDGTKNSASHNTKTKYIIQG
jgi:hypothetical protein